MESFVDLFHQLYNISSADDIRYKKYALNTADIIKTEGEWKREKEKENDTDIDRTNIQQLKGEQREGG